MILPTLPVSAEAIGLCLQLMAMYWSVRYLHKSDNVLSSIIGILMIATNTFLIGVDFGKWLGVLP